MLLDADAITCAVELVDETMFYREAHRRMFRAMLSLHQQGAVLDPLTLANELEKQGTLAAAGGKDYIGTLLDVVPTAANVAYHVAIVKEKAARRRLAKLGADLVLEAETGTMEPAAMRAAFGALLENDARKSGTGAERLAAPVSVRELIAAPEPAERDIVEGFVPTDANLLLAAYPKSHKTNLVLEIAVGATAAKNVLGRFPVRRRHRVGLVLMEDRAHRVRRRLHRLCEGHGITLEDLDGYLHLWFRPVLRLNDPKVMADMRAHVERLELDLLWIDSWAYVAAGNSDKDDIVSPQLDALTRLRDYKPGLAVGLTHHARKAQGETTAQRLTDVIRNSSHFSAWYDGGYVLTRTDEASPVTVRAELRDLPAPASFSFRVEDQFPGTPETRMMPYGWMRLTALEGTPTTVARDAAAAKLVPAVREYLAAQPGISKNKLREAIGAKGTDVDAAFDALVAAGAARFDPPERKGQAGRCWLNNDTSSGFVPSSSGTHSESTSTVRPTPLRGGRTLLTPTDGREISLNSGTRLEAPSAEASA
jgi:hypothetical protein